MALLAGSRLAAHTLQLTSGSQKLLPEIFPAVDHITRFNLQSETARELLLNADAYLGAVTIPYALAVHEDFVSVALDLVKRAGMPLLSLGKPIKAWNMHETLFRSLGAPLPAATLSQFHLLRHLRNALIHEGGAVSSQLIDAVNGMPGDVTVDWELLTGRHPQDILSSSTIVFTANDIFASFAISKRLGRDINSALQIGLPSNVWVELAVEHFLDDPASTGRTRNSDQWMRALWGYARRVYRELNLPEGELERAARTMGVWTRPAGSVPPRRRRK
ncbi:hypothetical protein B0I32_106329 [Nonomuraea fuscirosea]|uniref:Uncharacterized protein n=2 Tax=Nonomuraea fuscirosea TaxID=1291556 RepID=A0A2T0N2I6_9ACTN|nr:hypothetical protein B0I32_106329 [Nonomuraea fuscirosea]